MGVTMRLILIVFILMSQSTILLSQNATQGNGWLQDTQTEKDDTGCLFCELVVQVVDFQIENQATVEQIRNVLFAVCDMLQPGMEEDCKAIIYQLDLQTIIDIIVELGLRPRAVCEYLGFCLSLAFEKVN